MGGMVDVLLQDLVGAQVKEDKLLGKVRDVAPDAQGLEDLDRLLDELECAKAAVTRSCEDLRPVLDKIKGEGAEEAQGHRMRPDEAAGAASTASAAVAVAVVAAASASASSWMGSTSLRRDSVSQRPISGPAFVLVAFVDVVAERRALHASQLLLDFLK